jgi:hypothetical protein
LSEPTSRKAFLLREALAKRGRTISTASRTNARRTREKE